MKNFFDFFIKYTLILLPLCLIILFFFYYNNFQNSFEQPKLQGPEKFREYWSSIKGEGYYPGYKQVELNKMLNRLNDTRLSANNDQEDGDILFGSSAADAATFTERGPANVPGRTRSIIVDAADATGNTWYAASVGGGIWKGVYNSDPSIGTVWTNITPTAMENIAVTALAQSANNSSVIYAGTGEDWSYNVDAIDGGGIFKTTDAGTSWINITPTVGSVIDPKFGNISRIIVDPADENIVLVSTIKNASNSSYIFKSIDGGTSWTENEIGGNRIQQIVAAPSNFNIQYAAVRTKPVLKSEDAGDTWLALPEVGAPSEFGDTTLADNSYDRYELAVSATDPNKVYAGISKTFGPPGPSYLYRTLDGGSTWTHIPEKTVAEGGSAAYADDFWLNSQGWYDNCITVNPNDDNIVYVGGVQLFKFIVSGDNKKISTHLTDGYGDFDSKNYYVHVDHHFLGIIDDGAGNFRILNGSDGGVAVSNSAADPGNVHNDWVKAASGYNTTQFYGADKIKGSQQYIGGAQDNGTWWYSDSGLPASKTSNYNLGVGGDGLEVIAHWNNSDSMIGGYQYNGLYRTLNGGSDWAYIGTPWAPHDGTGTGPFINRLSTSYQDPDVVYAISSQGIHRSKDFGANWQLKPPSDGLGGWDDKDVEVSQANPRFVWAGGFITSSFNIYLSKDWGQTFDPVSNKPAGISGSVSGIYSHPNEDSTVYVLFSYFGRAKIYETKDLGDTWVDITGFPASWGIGVSSSGFPNVAVTSLAVMPFDSDVIWVGTDIGLVETTDRGTTWNIVASTMPHVSIWDMKIKDQGEIVLATHGRGIWTATIPDLVSWKPKQNLITLSVDVNSIAEASGVATITATAVKDVSPNSPITVSLAVSGTAAASDYTLSSSSVTLDSTSTTNTVTLTAVQDSEEESNETVIVDVSAVVNGKESGTQQVTVTITDDDSVPPTVTITVDNASIAEAAGVSTITATLDKAPSSGDVVISLSAGGTAAASDYTLSSTTITIASGTTGTATITAVQDAEDEDDETVVVDVSSVTNGTESGTQQVTVTITDDDETVAGFEDQTSVKEISIYPNPSSGIFTIKFNDTWKGDVDLRVLDIFGRPQYLRRIDNSSGQAEHEVDISSKTDGLFFVELSQDDKRVIRKILKQ